MTCEQVGPNHPAASFSAREAIFSLILDLRPNFRWWKYAPPFLVDCLYTTGPIFRLKPSQKGTVSVSNCYGAAPIAPCSDDQHMQLWARARTELTWLRYGLRLTSRSAGRSLCEHFPRIERFTCIHHTSHLYAPYISSLSSFATPSRHLLCGLLCAIRILLLL